MRRSARRRGGGAVGSGRKPGPSRSTRRRAPSGLPPSSGGGWTPWRGRAGFLDLEAAADRLPAGDPLRDRVARLRPAVRGDYLREAVVELYVDYWGEAGSAVRTADPAAARAFADRLTRFLHDTY